MDAKRDAILSLCDCPDQPEAHRLLDRLEADYLERFEPSVIADHMRSLLALRADRPVSLILRPGEAGLVECTVLAFDHPFEFSIITGLLAGTGFSIESSDVFTLRRTAGMRQPQVWEHRRPGKADHDPLKAGLIIDRFVGRLLGPTRDFSAWAEAFETAIREAISLLDRGDELSSERAKRLVNEQVTAWLTTRRTDAKSPEFTPTAQPMDIRVEQLAIATRLHLRAPDAPAFLYALSTALSLHGLSIHRTRVRTVEGRVEDQVDIVDAAGRPLVDPDRLDSVKLSVMLTQQFAYFVDCAPDPFMALSRFERLAEQITQVPERHQWLELLANPRTMAELAKVLGTSDYLWNEFIRLNPESLLPIFRPHVQGRDFCLPSYTIPRRLEEVLRGVRGIDRRQEALNEFKDRELLLIDLEHILSSDRPDASFQLLSQRLVLLAENLIATAARLVFDDLVGEYGRPLGDKRRKGRYAVFGLGKLGGVALGYASDIELLFVYEGEGRTTGGKRRSISNSQFFEYLAQRTSLFIRAKREGIFQVDLALRPWGERGPLACSREHFEEYYAPAGKAHPFEKLALARMRWIAGDPGLGFELEQVRDRLLYEGPGLDLDALWALWNKLHLKNRSNRGLNSKHSPGALADMEGAVQLLQVMHARTAPQLRTPRLIEAIESLRRAGLLQPREYEQLSAAYHFLRRLINAQRILRGSAQDLLLPPAGSDELTHLARRMRYVPGRSKDAGAALLADFQAHTAAVRRFIQTRFGRKPPGLSKEHP